MFFLELLLYFIESVKALSATSTAPHQTSRFPSRTIDFILGNYWFATKLGIAGEKSLRIEFAEEFYIVMIYLIASTKLTQFELKSGM